MEGNFVIFLYIFLFVFGASIGSFLNVLIDRLPRGEQIFKGRSYCDRCKHKLSWFDLFPIISWIALRGRCRYCRSPIGWYYPAVELLTGILFLLTAIFLTAQNFQFSIFNFQFILILAYYLFIISALIVISFADLKYQIIPDQIVYPAIGVSFVFSISQYPNISISSLLSSIGVGLFFFILSAATRWCGMGMGDVKLALLMGLILGFPKIIVALYLAFLTGAFFGVILILLGKKRFGQHIPFGPFLVTATVVSLFWGETLWQFLQKLLGFS